MPNEYRQTHQTSGAVGAGNGKYFPCTLKIGADDLENGKYIYFMLNISTSVSSGFKTGEICFNTQQNHI